MIFFGLTLIWNGFPFIFESIWVSAEELPLPLTPISLFYWIIRGNLTSLNLIADPDLAEILKVLVIWLLTWSQSLPKKRLVDSPWTTLISNDVDFIFLFINNYG